MTAKPSSNKQKNNCSHQLYVSDFLSSITKKMGLFVLGLFAIVCALFWVFFVRWLRSTGADQPVRGCVFVTGCDSGMGETTAFHLANKTGFHVFAACFTKDGS